MVYHYTNFIVETNAWWLRRVRPVSLLLSFRFYLILNNLKNDFFLI
jgi:hypothetical protein